MLDSLLNSTNIAAFPMIFGGFAGRGMQMQHMLPNLMLLFVTCLVSCSMANPFYCSLYVIYDVAFGGP